MLVDMLALAKSVCLLALSGFDPHVLDVLLCAGLIALCRVVLAVDTRRQHARTKKKKPNRNIKHEKKMALLLQKNEQRKRLAGKE